MVIVNSTCLQTTCEELLALLPLECEESARPAPGQSGVDVDVA